jgi:drug/metabolite transporter (DMT)-like permease
MVSQAPADATPQRSLARPLAALVLGAATIGFAPILMRLTETGPAAGGFWRLALALPLMGLLTWRERKAQPERSWRPPNMALIAGLMFALDLACWHYGVQLTSVANATVLSNLTPIIVTIVAWFVFREAPRRLFLLGLALAVTGAWTMALAHEKTGTSLLGDALSAGTAVWYSLYFLSVRQARRTTGVAAVMFWSGLVGAPIVLLAALVMGESILPAGPAGWAACAGLALVHVVGQGAIAWALGRLPTSTASVTVLVQPVVAAVLGWLIFAEALGPWQAAGGALALAGVVIAQRASVKP